MRREDRLIIVLVLRLERSGCPNLPQSHNHASSTFDDDAANAAGDAKEEEGCVWIAGVTVPLPITSMPNRSCAFNNVLCIRAATVIGPTPPGTGDIADAIWLTDRQWEGEKGTHTHTHTHTH